ncbi:MAG: hypothetical protein A2W05_03480 [Candidatus Schekmanbacteria bacterium RBG_16_38_10]|uniref:Poly A polymerase head domain-containing protein n=1 Tax=Candidatus Schekmanbacteria bacterium RBG_16_38_10 TaxID=1817879 RepID=A0A1F7RUE6_9BACT|nr:MAG: hypothetical protein A2W05_03480 [Candidatus Schekmanbacteria bacterium RBG_16_38_10]
MKIDEFKKLIEEKIHRNKEIKLIKEIADELKIPLYLVGGFLRDAILSRENVDLDFIVNGEPDKISKKVAERLRAKLIIMDKQDIINYRIVKRGMSVDFAEVFQADIHKDLARRDFTINSIAYSLSEKKLYDDFDGIGDLEKGIIKMVSDDTFDNDPLRMLRAVRYFTTLEGFYIEKKTLSLIALKKDLISRASPERIKEEMDKIILSGNPVRGMVLLIEIKILETLFFKSNSTMQIKPVNTQEEKGKLIAVLKIINELIGKTLFDGSQMIELKYSPDDLKIIYYAAIVSFLWSSFFKTEIEIKDIVSILKNMRFSNIEISRICRVIDGLKYFFELSETKELETDVRRLIHKTGRDVLILMVLGNAILRALGKENYKQTVIIRTNILRIFNKDGDSIINPKKLIDGKDIIRILKCEEGERVGKIIKEIKKLQIENKISTRREAMELVEVIDSNLLD